MASAREELESATEQALEFLSAGRPAGAVFGFMNAMAHRIPESKSEEVRVSLRSAADESPAAFKALMLSFDVNE